MLEELLREIGELQRYKTKYEYAVADKQTMSNLLYEYQLKEWENMSREERIAEYEHITCKLCRHSDYCSIELPEDIRKPIPSDTGYIPLRVDCGEFEWS